ncbi:D-Ala-D-Ala carboxypeptidase family metallohydrolase [Candidatus Uabimicrobium sp. HlEnr_7]|uniref:D-Ala-D-Ala carboxypeptidase family metallohydrolase n=1 Tax=Candidatus Uabimicrobium helgolandensis TaxID=3095367 RepID=UPI003558BF67
MKNTIKIAIVVLVGIINCITAQEICGVAEDCCVTAEENLVDVFAVSSSSSHKISLHTFPIELGKNKALFLKKDVRIRSLASNEARSILAVAQMKQGQVDLINRSGKIIKEGIAAGDLIQSITFHDGEFAVLSRNKGLFFIDEHGQYRGHITISRKAGNVSFGNGLFAVTSFDGDVYFFKNPNVRDLTTLSKNNHAQNTTLQTLVYREGETMEISLPARKSFVGFGAKEIVFGDDVFLVTNPQNASVSVFNSEGVPANFNTGKTVVDGQNAIYTGHKFLKGLTYGAGSFVVTNSQNDSSGSSIIILRRGKEIKHVELFDSFGQKGTGTLAVSFLPDGKDKNKGIFAISTSASNRVYFMSPNGDILGSQETAENPTNIVAFKVHNEILNTPATISANSFENVIRKLGGSVVKPTMFPKTVDGFQMYLDAVGVRYFSAKEMTRPNHPDIARQCGFNNLLPSHGDWAKGAALALLADKLRALVNEPVKMRNWWRPSCYNEKVGGAKGSDHVQAFAVDLDFRSAKSRAKAQGYLCANYWSSDLQLSIGLGGVTIHLGILSPKGKRNWKYKSYTKLPNSGNCW